MEYCREVKILVRYMCLCKLCLDGGSARSRVCSATDLRSTGPWSPGCNRQREYSRRSTGKRSKPGIATVSLLHFYPDAAIFAISSGTIYCESGPQPGCTATYQR